jgi:hypothetical protein
MRFTKLVSFTLATFSLITSSATINIQKAMASWDSDVPNNYVTHLNLARTNQAINMNAPTNGRFIGSFTNTNGDKDQELKIVRIGGNRVYIMKNGTNMVLSVKDGAGEQSELEAWNYVPGAWQQVWEMTPATIPGAYNIRLAAKPSMGVNIPFSRHNVRITLATIGRGDMDQEFGLSYGYQGSATVNPSNYVAPMPRVNIALNTKPKSTSPTSNPPITQNGTKSSPITVQGGNEGSGAFWTTVCLLFCGPAVGEIGNTILNGNKIVGVSLDKDGESWEKASDECQRKGGFLQWYINDGKNYAEKTCFVTRNK